MDFSCMTTVFLSEVTSLYAMLPTWFLVTMLALYVAIGGLFWSRLMLKWQLEEGLEDHLVFADRVGTSSRGETIALLIVKGVFLAFWPLYVLLVIASIIVGLTRPRALTTT